MSRPEEEKEYFLSPFLFIIIIILFCTGLLYYFSKNPIYPIEDLKQMFRLEQTDASLTQTSTAASTLMNALQQAQNAQNEKLAAEETARQQELEQQEQQQAAGLSAPEEGRHYANIIIERLGMNVPLYYGDSNAILKKGAGQYTGSSLPGDGSQILVAAHNTNYFKALQNIENGDIIKVVTGYGEFHYQVIDIVIAKATDSSTYNLSLEYEQLILYTCYPFTGPPGKTERFFVYANRIE